MTGQSRGYWGDGSTPCHVEYYGPILQPCPTCGEPEPTVEIMRDCSLCNPPTPDRSGEADETSSGSAEGESGLPEGSSK